MYCRSDWSRLDHTRVCLLLWRNGFSSALVQVGLFIAAVSVTSAMLRIIKLCHIFHALEESRLPTGPTAETRCPCFCSANIRQKPCFAKEAKLSGLFCNGGGSQTQPFWELHVRKLQQSLADGRSKLLNDRLVMLCCSSYRLPESYVQLKPSSCWSMLQAVSSASCNRDFTSLSGD